MRAGGPSPSMVMPQRWRRSSPPRSEASRIVAAQGCTACRLARSTAPVRIIAQMLEQHRCLGSVMIAARDRPHIGLVAGHLGELGRQIDRCATLIGALEAVGCDRPSMSTAARLARLHRGIFARTRPKGQPSERHAGSTPPAAVPGSAPHIRSAKDVPKQM